MRKLIRKNAEDKKRSGEGRISGHREGFHPLILLGFAAVTLLTLIICVCIGSVNVPFADTVLVLWKGITRQPVPGDITAGSIILSVRLPRVMCVALTGASLSLCGSAVQGLLKNPLADGSTLGVSSGASLGAVLAIAFNTILPHSPFSGTMVMAIGFAFLSFMVIMALAYRLDYSLSTNTIVLIGIIYSMFVNSIMSLVVTFAHDKVKSITFWTMGSLAGSSYRSAAVLGAVLAAGYVILFRFAQELNAFAIGEDNARHVGVNVRRVRIIVLITVSALIGVCVSIGGTIGFVGLVTPHIVRMITGPNHRRLLPAVMFGGAVFLMLADLTARVILRPLELPIGVVTSFIGAVLFVYIFYKTRTSRGGR